MKKTRKILFIICVSMIGAGAVLCLIGWLMGGRVTGVGINGNGKVVVYGPNMENTNTEYHVFSDTLTDLEAFRNIHLNVDYADVSIIPSDHYGLEYQLVEHSAPQITLADGSLSITPSPEVYETFHWFYNGSTFSYPSADEYVKVYVPHDAVLEYLNITNDSGDVSLRGLNAQTLDLKAEYGDVTLSKTDCTDVTVKMESGILDINGLNSSTLSVSNEYGDISLSDVTVTDNTELSLDSGDIDLNSVSTGDLQLRAEYGHFNGSYVVMNDAKMKLSSGDCLIEYCDFQNMDIDAEYGSVDLLLSGDIQYNYDIKTEYGDTTVMGQSMGERYKSVENEYSNTIRVRCDSGNVTIDR